MPERLAYDIAADLRAAGGPLMVEAADKLEGLITLLAQADRDGHATHGDAEYYAAVMEPVPDPRGLEVTDEYWRGYRDADNAHRETLHALVGDLADVAAELDRQDRKWGTQNHPDGTGAPIHRSARERYRDTCQRHAAAGSVSWLDVLLEEVYEAAAESDPAKLRTELVQVAAVAVQWMRAIDRRQVAAGCAHPLCGGDGGVCPGCGRSPQLAIHAALRAAFPGLAHDETHGWTSHGRRCCVKALGPSPVARCGGPGTCGQCGTEVAALHAAAVGEVNPCGNVQPGLIGETRYVCTRPAGHGAPHRQDGTAWWPLCRALHEPAGGHDRDARIDGRGRVTTAWLMTTLAVTA